MLIFDAHLDLAMNAMEWNLDYVCRWKKFAGAETGLMDKPDRANGVVLLSGNAPRSHRYMRGHPNRPPRQTRQQIAGLAFYRAGLTWAQTQGQLAWYRAMEEAGELISIRTRGDLARQVALWQNSATEGEARAIGYILSLEGADSLVTLHHLEKAFCIRIARGWPGTLRPRSLRPRHQRHRWLEPAWTRFAQGNGPAGNDSRRDTPLR